MENNKALQTHSKNLPEQSKQLKNDYLKLTTNEEEKEFLDCFFLTPIKDSSVAILPKVIEDVTQLRLFVGAIKDVDSKQIQFEAQTIVKNFPFLTLDEISLAFKLFTQNKLMPLDRVLNYPNFSSLFISQIINSYIEYRRALIDELKNRKKPQIEYRPSAAEQAQDMKYMINEVANLIKTKQYYIVILNTVFNFLYRIGRLKPSQEDIYNGAKYADDKYAVGRSSRIVRLDDVLTGNHVSGDKEHMLETFTREYCLKRYFASKPLSEILNEVTENDFNK